MPTFANPAQFAKAIGDVERELEREAKRRITVEQAREAQKIARRAASDDLGGDPKFSGWAPRLATKLKPARNGATLLAPTKQSAGPWTVAEFGRNQGTGGGGAFFGPGVNRRYGTTARTKAGDIRKVRRFRARRWNGYTVGKGTATTAVNEMDRRLPDIADDGVRQVLRKRFDVT